MRPTALTIGLIIHFSIALLCVYTECGINSSIISNCTSLHFQFNRDMEVTHQSAHQGNLIYELTQ